VCVYIYIYIYIYICVCDVYITTTIVTVYKMSNSLFLLSYRSHNAAMSNHLPPSDNRSNYGLHHVIIDSPCKPIRTNRTPCSSHVPNLPSIMPHKDAQRFDWALMTSYRGLQRHLVDIRTIDILHNSLSSNKGSKQVGDFALAALCRPNTCFIN